METLSASLAMTPDSIGYPMEPIWGQSGADRTQVGTMLALDFASRDGSPPVTVRFPSQRANNVEFDVLMLTV